MLALNEPTNMPEENEFSGLPKSENIGLLLGE
jgi:hypothetical protein